MLRPDLYKETYKSMKAKERTINFIKGEKVDRLPFHPFLMQFAAKQANVPYSEYCLKPKRQADALIYIMENYGLDYITVGAHAYCEATAYGLPVEFPFNNLPYETSHVINDPEIDLSKIKPLKIENHELMMKRVETISEFKNRVGDDLFVSGWFEGPMAEYADLRGLSGACVDLFMYEEPVKEAMGVIVENAKAWATLQVEAGADCIGIGDAAASQIGPDLYEQFVFNYHKELVEHIHSLGVYAKIHICGDISPILPSLIKAGFNIIDIDHLVKDMSPFVNQLGKEQVLLGNLDPVSVIQDGTPEKIIRETIRCAKETNGRGIVSAGCEIPRDTPIENYKAYFEACRYASEIVI